MVDKWEYLTLSDTAPGCGPIGHHQIQECGALGWELVSVISVNIDPHSVNDRKTYFFKRKLQQ